MGRGKWKTFPVRRKQRLGLGWLLLLLVVGLPVAVFLAWKEQNPLPAISESRKISSDAPVMEAVPAAPPEESSPAETPAPKTAVPDAGPEKSPAEVPSKTPEPVSQKPEARAASASTPAPSEAPPTAKLDWAKIAASPELWPVQTRMKSSVDFPISVGGKPSGSTRVPPGTVVKIVKITEDGAEIAFAESSAKVAFDQTTLGDQVMNGESRPVLPTVEKSPAPAQPPRPAATPPKNDGSSLVPQQNWCKAPGDERANLIELLKVLEHDSRADKSLEISEHPEILRGVTLMMPIREAMAKLGVKLDLIPTKSAVLHPGIPLYFRTLPCKYSLVGQPDDYFNLLTIVTDADDRVVGIQFVCENPSSKMYFPKEDFRTYNFVTNRGKSSTTLKVGCEVTAASDEVLLIESWLYDERRDKSLEIVRWYLPKRIGNFLRHVIEARLDLAG